MLAVVPWFETLPEEPVRFVTVIVSHCLDDRRSFPSCQHYQRKINLIAGLLTRRIQIGVDQDAFLIFADVLKICKDVRAAHSHVRSPPVIPLQEWCLVRIPHVWLAHFKIHPAPHVFRSPRIFGLLPDHPEFLSMTGLELVYRCFMVTMLDPHELLEKSLVAQQ